MIGNRKINVFGLALFVCVSATVAQKAERSNIRDGNKQYQKDQYTEAEISYRKGIDVNPRSTEGIYNLGNALYKQEKFPEAVEQYQLIAGQGARMLNEDPDNAARLAQTFHNIGNVGMKNKEYQQSIEAYKQALRLNPNDDETRYNLALAQKLLEDQQQQDQDQDQDKQDQDKQDQEQQQDQQQDQPQEQQPEEQQTEQMSRETAQQLLDAFLQDEKNTQEKVKEAQMQQQQSRQREKQW